VEIRLGGADLFDDMHAVLGSSATFRRIFGPELLGDPGVCVAVGYLDGEPVSAATAIRSASTLGIYAVATIERARRRGIGRAVTWAAIEAGRSTWGSRIAVLQSSEMGLPVYASMGFVEVARYIAYERPAP
jgi:GNAT superfamily N-acetyltransferase